MNTLPRRLFVLGFTLTLALVSARAQSLTDALDAPQLNWTTSGGGTPWTPTTTMTHDGVDAATTGTLPSIGAKVLKTTLTNHGTLTFWAKASLAGA